MLEQDGLDEISRMIVRRRRIHEVLGGLQDDGAISRKLSFCLVDYMPVCDAKIGINKHYSSWFHAEFPGVVNDLRQVAEQGLRKEMADIDAWLAGRVVNDGR
jgi:hypothetical protein